VLYPNTHALIEITQEELALLAGLSRQVANKALAGLEAAGLVTTQHGKIVVPCPEKLGSYGSRDETEVPAPYSLI
jgi:CRP/FNR family cyclic AMP-dependent transcriptional regulator